MTADNNRDGIPDAPLRLGRRIVSVPTDTGRSSRRTKTSRSKSGGSASPFGQADPREGAAGRRRPQPAPKSEDRLRWEKATEGVTSVHGRPFDPGRVYTEGDIILHKQFGMGVVETPAGTDEAVNVLFREGVEILALELQDD